MGTDQPTIPVSSSPFHSLVQLLRTTRSQKAQAELNERLAAFPSWSVLSPRERLTQRYRNRLWLPFKIAYYLFAIPVSQ